MKNIVDAGFPPVTDIRVKTLSKALYKKKRRYAYKILENGSVYFHFPRINMFKWFVAAIIIGIAKSLKRFEPIE